MLISALCRGRGLKVPPIDDVLRKRKGETIHGREWRRAIVAQGYAEAEGDAIVG